MDMTADLTGGPVGNLLVSFAEGIPTVEKALAIPNTRVLLDSGAFANYTKQRDIVTLDTYTGFLRERGREFWRYIALDKIADADTSRRNLDVMLSQGLTPMPVFQRGSDLAELHRLASLSDIVAIGGIARRLNQIAHRAYLDQVTRAILPQRTHLLGCGNESILYQHRPYSSDSSGHARSRWAHIIFRYRRQWYDLARTTSGEVLLNNRLAQPERALLARLCEEYDLHISDSFTREFYTSDASKVICLRAYLRFTEELRRIGVMYFNACVNHDVGMFAMAIHLERERHARLHAAA
jgi:hypothetical protein